MEEHDPHEEETDEAGELHDLLGLTGARPETDFTAATSTGEIDEPEADDEPEVHDEPEADDEPEVHDEPEADDEPDIPEPVRHAEPEVADEPEFDEPTRHVEPTLEEDPFDDIEGSSAVEGELGLEPLFGVDGLEGVLGGPMADRWESARDEATADLPGGDQPLFTAQTLQVIEAIEKGMRSKKTTEIHGNGPGRITAKVRGRNVMLQGYAFASNQEYLSFIKELIRRSQTHVSWNEVESASRAVIAMRDGSRLTVKLPPLVEFPTFSIRKHSASLWSPDRFIEEGLMLPEMMAFLRSCVAARVNMLIVGGMGSGKTSLMRTLANDFGDDERIAVIEQVRELRLTKPQTQEITYVPGTTIDLDEALDVELYDSIDRLIVGEVHTRGLGTMLEVMKITQGSMSTYHADTAEDMVSRMRVALQKAEGLTPETALDDIRQAIELVVVLERIGDKYTCIQVREIDHRLNAGAQALAGRDLFTWNRVEKRWDKPSRPDDEGRIVGKALKWGVPLNAAWHDDAAALAAFTSR